MWDSLSKFVKVTAGAVVCCCLLLLLLAVILGERIPPDALTRGAIHESALRANMYAVAHKAVPPSLEVLPKREGYANNTTDGWGRTLQYNVNEDGVMTFTSFGADGKPGGVGEDADYVWSLPTRSQDGSLWIGSNDWLQNCLSEAYVRGVSPNRTVRMDEASTKPAAPGK
jgi:hypothetical protein